MKRPSAGIATDAGHSVKRRKTQYRAIDLQTGKEIFRYDIGYQTVNIGEFLGVVEAIKYIIKNNYDCKIVYTDSQTAIRWIQAKKTNSMKKNFEVLKAEIYLKIMAFEVDKIKVIHWNNKVLGEIPADFGYK